MRIASRLSSDGDRPPRILEWRHCAPDHVAGVFVQIPRDLAGKSVRAALWFESAGVAIQFAGAIESCALGCDAASGNRVGASELDKLFARRARVTVAFGVEGEVGAGERAVGSVGLVEDRNERRSHSV